MEIKNILNEIEENIHSGELDNSDLVQLIELAGSYLNICTIPNFSKQNNLSYNGVKKFRNIKTIFGVKFVIEND